MFSANVAQRMANKACKISAYPPSGSAAISYFLGEGDASIPSTAVEGVDPRQCTGEGYGKVLVLSVGVASILVVLVLFLSHLVSGLHIVIILKMDFVRIA